MLTIAVCFLLAHPKQESRVIFRFFDGEKALSHSWFLFSQSVEKQKTSPFRRQWPLPGGPGKQQSIGRPMGWRRTVSGKGPGSLSAAGPWWMSAPWWWQLIASLTWARPLCSRQQSSRWFWGNTTEMMTGMKRPSRTCGWVSLLGVENYEHRQMLITSILYGEKKVILWAIYCFTHCSLKCIFGPQLTELSWHKEGTCCSSLNSPDTVQVICSPPNTDD